MRNRILILLSTLLILSSAVMVLGCTRESSKKENEGKHSASKKRPQSPAVNVYLENSGSMDGYVTEQSSDFKSAVYDYLSEINMAVIDTTIKEMNLFYINDSVLPMPKDLDTFIKELSPAKFKEMGGKRGTTKICDLMKKTLPNSSSKCSVLISDLILSPGKGHDAEQFLSMEENEIKETVYEAITKDTTLSVMVYRLKAKFKGLYFDKQDNVISLNNKERPYFIMVIGSADNVRKLRDACPEDKIGDGNVENVWSFTNCGQKVEYAVAKNSGDFSLDREDPKHIIKDLKSNKRGKVGFKVNVDFSTLLLDDKYLLDTSNYEMSEESKYKIVDVEEYTDDDKKFTHRISVESKTGKPVKGVVEIKLKCRFPDIDKYNDNDGSKDHIMKSLDKTYGIKNILKGIYGAFTHKGDDYCKIKIKIN